MSQTQRLRPFEQGGRPAGPAKEQAPASLPPAVLSGITHLLVSEGPADRVLSAVADALGELVPHDTLTLYQADPPVRVLRPILVRDEYAAEIVAMGPVPYGRGIVGITADAGVPQLVNDAHLDPRAHQIPGTPVDPESMLAVPLLSRDELKGVLCLYRVGEGNRFSVKEFKLAIVFSELAALAIDNADIRTRLETEVVTDHLTALYNHRFFHERLAEELRRANRQRSTVGLVIYDIDDFKRVNDTYGHLVGDQVLQGVASVSRETCRTEDVICRIGGEEFAIILPGCDLAESLAMAERLREAIADVAFPDVGPVTISVGVAEGPLHASSPRELMTCADLALLQAKGSGKNCVLSYAGITREPVGPLETGPLDIAEVARDVLAFRLEPGGRVEPNDANGNGKGNGANGNGNGRHARKHGDGDGHGSGTEARLVTLAARGELRSLAHLRMLQSLSAKLNRLNDVRQIGEVITAELRSLIDYHNCRVFLLQPDGETLLPVAFRGELSEYQGETYDALVIKIGTGLTGHVAATGQSHYAPDAANDPFAVNIPGTPDLDESILGVPMRYGDRVIGVVVLSKLGIDQFDEEDMRLLEALGASAAIAFENARLLQAEHESAERSRTLLELSQALTRASGTEAVLDEALLAIPAMLPCRGVAALIRDDGTGDFVVVRDRGFDVGDGGVAGHRMPRRVVDRFLKSVDEPFVLTREVAAKLPEEHRAAGPVREMLVAPMRWEPAGLGALTIIAPDETSRFSERDLQLARGIADITSLAVGNAQRFVELEKAYFSTVEALANALEAQDEYTVDHCRALAELAIAVGVELGLKGERLKVLELGALFHDIGKIGIPSEIIRKPGPLTAAERREMNRHTLIGEEILAPVPFLQAVRPIVRSSHERWDGNGYPDGLAGAKIPLESRIIFVCDAFHAMTTDRPYRSALAESEAIRRLKLSAGTQFDPEVVRVFVELHGQGKIHFHHPAPQKSLRTW